MNINNYLDQPDKVCYELWSEDMFSYETYCIGLYASNSSANRAMRKLEAVHAEMQDEGLRDQMWIKRTTIAEHVEMLRQKKELQHKTWAMIDQHKAIIKEVWNDFRNMVQTHGAEEGEHALFLHVSHPDSELVKLTVENHYDYERKRKGPKTYHMEVGIYFKGNWRPARIKSSNLSMRSGTLEALGKHTHEEMFFEHCLKHFNKTVEKYFYGD
mgnify:CR=1 FL=1